MHFRAVETVLYCTSLYSKGQYMTVLYSIAYKKYQNSGGLHRQQCSQTSPLPTPHKGSGVRTASSIYTFPDCHFGGGVLGYLNRKDVNLWLLDAVIPVSERRAEEQVLICNNRGMAEAR